MADVDTKSRVFKSKRSYGWKRDKKDKSDDYYIKHHRYMGRFTLPPKVSLAVHCPRINDQEDLGSCTAHAVCAAYQTERARQGLKEFIPSRLFEYYNSRKISGTENEDCGASIRDSLVAVATIGLCRETSWPYDITKFAMEPGPECYVEAENHKILRYQRLKAKVEDAKMALALQYPVVFGFNVYESFESDEVEKTGIMPMPKDGENIISGHAAVLVGYDDNLEINGLKGYFEVRNSWGQSWGKGGYFYMPYAYWRCADGGIDDPWIISLITRN